ncbi:MAG TPA: ABC transporter [Microbacterium sp.]|nr:ABC transporter [Microbacterium sp.]
MSDPQASKPEAPIGEPVAEPTPTDDVVGRANGSLADAEAARDGVPADASRDDSVSAVPAEHDTTSAGAAHRDDVRASEADTAVVPPRSTSSSADDVPWYDRPEHLQPAGATAPDTTHSSTTAAGTTAAAGASAAAATPVASSEPAYATQTPQPIFVQAPEAPLPRGNRGAAGAIGLLAALSFAVLLLLASIGFGLITGDVTIDGLLDATLAVLVTWAFWVPVVVFFIAFWLLGAIINRGRWGHWVVFGLLVGVASYVGFILGQLFQAPFWMLSASQGAGVVDDNLLAPLAIASFVIGRELTIWFGAWVSARGKRVTELNIEAQREYERTLEAGPKLVRQ